MASALTGLTSVALVTVAVAMTGAWATGWKLQAVTSESMSPAVPRGALAIVAPADPGSLAPGQVVTFHAAHDRDVLVMHRITAVGVRDAERAFRMQGDANPTGDPLLVPDGDVVGVLRWHIPAAGAAALWLQTSFGRAVFIGVLAVALLAELVHHRPRRGALSRQPHRAGRGSAGG